MISRLAAKRIGGSRTGATLVEVLMSLLIMSIGIVSVVTMFPLAVLRSIQATQLTNSKLAKQNVQQLLRSVYKSPLSATTGAAFSYQIINQSTFPRTGGTRPYFRGTWEPNSAYLVGEIVVPSRKAGSPVPTPNLWFVCETAGTSGEYEPNWIANPSYPLPAAPQIVDNTVGWRANVQTTLPAGLTQRPFQPVFLNGVAYDGLNYVVDPLGWQMFSSGFSLDTTTTSANDFGYFSSNGLGSGVAGTNYGSPALIFANHRLLRINGGLTDLTSTTNALAISEGFGLHGDTWNVEIVSLIESVTTVGALAGNRAAVFPSTVDLSPYVSPNGQVRIVLSNVDQTMTVTRILEPIDLSVAVDPVTRTVMWREPLPTGFVPDGICRLERVDKRYSWLATVNKQTNGTAKVTVAVVFKRSFTPDDEHVYSTNFATGFADQASVSWGAGEPKPLLREGNYVLDAMTARWYRILAVSGSTSPVTVTFDQKIPLNHQVTGGRLIVMRGIVEIFEL